MHEEARLDGFEELAETNSSKLSYNDGSYLWIEIVVAVDML